MSPNLIAHSWAEQVYRQRLAEEVAKARHIEEITQNQTVSHTLRSVCCAAESRFAGLRRRLKCFFSPDRTRPLVTHGGAPA